MATDSTSRRTRATRIGRHLPAALLVLAAAGVSTPRAAAAPSSPGSWQTVASGPTLPSGDHTATLLRDGRVLVVGGQTCGRGCNGKDQGVTSAELYDPISHGWAAARPAAVPREYHTATLLQDGRVLVAGGFLATTMGDATTSAELYSPGTDSWTAAPPMRTGRLGHTATLLGSGKVLVAGGLSRTPTGFAWDDSAELFDPVKASWSPAGTMNAARAEHTATLLPDGTVLVAGGRNTLGGRRPPLDTVALNTAELYLPATNSWKLVPHLLHPGRAEHTATLLPDGTVMLAGGAVTYYHGGTSDPTGVVEQYNPVARTLAALPSLPEPRSDQTATLLADGRVLLVGGIRFGDNVRSGLEHHEPAFPRLFDPALGLWTPAAPIGADPSPHGERGLIEYLLAGRHTATLLAGGKVLVVGGDDEAHAAHLFDPAGTAAEPAAPAQSLFTNRNLELAGGAAGAVVVLAALATWRIRRRRRFRW